ncbi:M61 family metallopeptidase [Puia dinghuensis]|uniref:Peptidase M61 n=1 Tax=Puia dinghuensis TaxID=1792502 RepID=A0A8J2XW10_9BACT|nr:PDZ domain-containing protein [Puia dinghuensis]GGB20626.1 peptidase M61 [Puia dinghuensis]
MKNKFYTGLLAMALLWTLGAAGQDSPTVNYILAVDTSDLSGYWVAIQLKNAGHHFHLAMATHHEYDSRFWRYVRDLRLQTPNGRGRLVRKDSALWEVSIRGNEARLTYRIQLPGPHRFAHIPFLASYGGLAGDLHSFMYIPEHPEVACTVTFQIPDGWAIATGLERTTDHNSFSAASAPVLMDCPVLLGQVHSWDFFVKKVRHTVAYLAAGNGAIGFDTVRLVNTIRKIAEQAAAVFDSLPYPNYTFLLEDSVGGALEHRNSVTIGAPASVLASEPDEFDEEIAHEFFHTWNLMYIKPAEYTPLNYGPQEESAGLWLSEGLSMFYADLIMRRARLPVEDSTRLDHLEGLIQRYYTDTGNQVIPPARVSLASNALPGRLGDFSASVHLQGELYGALLDILIRAKTNNQRSFDDVMRLVFRRFGGEKGFYGKDIEQCVRAVCPGTEVTDFFQRFIYEGRPLEFNTWLGLIGLRMDVAYQEAVNKNGMEMVDKRLYVWSLPGDTTFRVQITHPGSCWAKAGLHSGDVIVDIDGMPVKTREDFNNRLNRLHVGDTVAVAVQRPEGMKAISVVIQPYVIPVVHLSRVGGGEVYDHWAKGE